MATHVVLAANVGVLLAIVGGGFALDRRVGLRRVRAALPDRVRVGVELLAFGVYGPLLFVEPVAVPVLNETILALGVFVGLWIGLPVLAASLLDAEPPTGAGADGCDR